MDWNDLPVFERRAAGALVPVRGEKADAYRQSGNVRLVCDRVRGRRLVALTEQEIAERAEAAAREQQEAAAKAAAEASAIEKLKAIGLTDDEIQALRS